MAKKTSSKEKPLLTGYKDTLKQEEIQRYVNKLSLIEGNDPYELIGWSDCEENLPSVSYPDIVNYLVFTPSPYTLEDLKAYKNTDCYKQALFGWVSDEATFNVHENIIVSAKVLHSMRIREKQLVPWIVATKDGVIKAAHCNCQAGLGECCSHVAALMFSLDIKVRLRDSKTVTEKPAYWMLPQAVKKIDYNELREIDFTTAKTLKKRVDSYIENSDSVNSAKPKPRTVQIEYK